MGVRFHKSINMGPVRLNLGKSGIGYSIGTKGFRIAKKANGGVRTTASIPGTGISYINENHSSESQRGGLATLIILPFKLCWWFVKLCFWMCYFPIWAMFKIAQSIIRIIKQGNKEEQLDEN